MKQLDIMQLARICAKCGVAGCYLKKCVSVPAPGLGKRRIKYSHIEWRCERHWVNEEWREEKMFLSDIYRR